MPPVTGIDPASDPVLETHKADDFRYEISGRSPLSIRDQMVRAVLVVDRAVECGLIGAGRPLVVIGAGAAGATAALRASKTHRVRTRLLEYATDVFSRQKACTSRFVCPTQYDFPLGHWQKKVMPAWCPPDLPMRWSAAQAHRLAGQWAVVLMASVLDGLVPLDLETSVRYPDEELIFEPPTEERRFVGVNWIDKTGHRRRDEAAIVISAVGLGEERSSVAPLHTTAFWDPDNLERERFGLVAAPSYKRIRAVVSGGGDGGLQDVLRILTGMPAGDIYNRLQDVEPDVFNDVARIISDAEDHAARSMVWSAGKLHDCGIQKRLEAEHLRAFRLIKDRGIEPYVYRALESCLRKDRPESVTLVYPCAHFGSCYALNRFLVMMLANIREVSRLHLKPGWRVRDARSRVPWSHTCGTNAKQCYGRSHDLILEGCDCRGRTSGAETLTGEINVIRHGIAPITGAWSYKFSNPFTRDLLPYHLPN